MISFERFRTFVPNREFFYSDDGLRVPAAVRTTRIESPVMLAYLLPRISGTPPDFSK